VTHVRPKIFEKTKTAEEYGLQTGDIHSSSSPLESTLAKTICPREKYSSLHLVGHEFRQIGGQPIPAPPPPPVGPLAVDNPNAFISEICAKEFGDPIVLSVTVFFTNLP
jgi:hypothetical protein